MRLRVSAALLLAASIGGAAAAQPGNDLRAARLAFDRGALDTAEARYRAAVEAGGSTLSTARVGLATVLAVRGRRTEARPLLESVILRYERGGVTRADIVAAARAWRLLGAADAQAFKDALRAYDEAIAADSSDLALRVELGEMFLEKFNSGDAKAMFRGVLAADSGHPDALAAEARRRQFDGEPGAAELARRALGRDAGHVKALLLLASLALSTEDYAEATTQAEAALSANRSSREALATLAIARRGAGDARGAEAARRRLAAIDPSWSGLALMQAEHAVRTRRYDEAVGFARDAVRADPRDWRAYAMLGLNLLRVGSPAAARDTLEIAFRGDPYDVWTKNTLDLLDTFEEYDEVRVGRFLFFVDRRHAGIIARYAGELAEDAWTRLVERYRYRPPTPIRIELYRTSADFSVRTVGLPGLGALGVAFGSTLVMDSPAARERGTYNWGSTMWHEIVHAFTLGASGHNVPRWMTEGLSVLEERRARPGWGDEPGPPFFRAYLDGRLLPVSRLNDGFVRPSFPEQIGFSYYQASLVMEMIEQEFGMDAIRAALAGYRQGLAPATALERALGIDAAALDARYEAWFRARFATAIEAMRHLRSEGNPAARPVADSTSWIGLLRRGARLAREGKSDAAIAVLKQAKAAYPDYTGPDASYRQLARLHAAAGRPTDAAAELAALTSIDGNDYDALVELAALREQAGDAAGAAEALERAVYIYPFEIPLHERLATLAAKLGRHDAVIRERRTVVDLGPVDRAEALYQLARAELAAGRTDAAKRSVLRALEIAPRFARAQDLLLELEGRP